MHNAFCGDFHVKSSFFVFIFTIFSQPNTNLLVEHFGKYVLLNGLNLTILSLDNSATYQKLIGTLQPAFPWWRHQLETFSALLALCAENSPFPCEFPSQNPVTWRSDVYFDLRLNKRLSKQAWGWRFEMPLRSLWRHCNGGPITVTICHSLFKFSWKLLQFYYN